MWPSSYIWYSLTAGSQIRGRLDQLVEVPLWAIVCSLEVQPDMTYYGKFITAYTEAGIHYTRRHARPTEVG
jgi:hypothetical protein